MFHLPEVVRSWGLEWKLGIGQAVSNGFVGVNRHAGIGPAVRLVSLPQLPPASVLGYTSISQAWEFTHPTPTDMSFGFIDQRQHVVTTITSRLPL